MTEEPAAEDLSNPPHDLMERVVNLCKRRGFIFPSAEIYGGFRSTYDYGPLGVAHAAQREGRLVAGHGPGRATTWSASTPPSCRPPRSGRPRAT